MNARILKKLSKRAEPILSLIEFHPTVEEAISESFYLIDEVHSFDILANNNIDSFDGSTPSRTDIKLLKDGYTSEYGPFTSYEILMATVAVMHGKRTPEAIPSKVFKAAEDWI